MVQVSKPKIGFNMPNSTGLDELICTLVKLFTRIQETVLVAQNWSERPLMLTHVFSTQRSVRPSSRPAENSKKGPFSKELTDNYCALRFLYESGNAKTQTQTQEMFL